MADRPEQSIPQSGESSEAILARISSMRGGDLDWRDGRAFSLVYNSGDHEHEHLLETVATEFQHDNALNPFAYPSLLQMELDLIAMAAGLFGSSPEA